jgi:sulfate adenylyltransferase subunit 1
MSADKKLIRIATAGSVDDGKSSLIGRLLYETKSLAADRLEAIERSSRQKGYDYLDLSLATDGLVAEREQGITIDVAHIYSSTPETNFIIADTPGHAEYTRNMVTGASTSQVAIILIDARKGISEQTYRHFFISNLLGMQQVIIAINKMDLVNYDEAVFEKIKRDFTRLALKSRFETAQICFIPVSALKGDNITSVSSNMPWYQGPHLLEQLEKTEDLQNVAPARFPVQYVIRPKTDDHHDFRGFAGKLYGGSLKTGDAVTVLPSMTKTKIKSIHFFDKEYEEAAPGASISICLENEVNISRGDMLVKSDELPGSLKQITASLCQLNKTALRADKRYILQHGVNRVAAKVEAIESRLHTDFNGQEEADSLELNEIGRVSLKLSKPIFADRYTDNRENGSFILIDEQSFETVSVGFVE